MLPMPFQVPAQVCIFTNTGLLSLHKLVQPSLLQTIIALRFGPSQRPTAAALAGSVQSSPGSSAACEREALSPVVLVLAATGLALVLSKTKAGCCTPKSRSGSYKPRWRLPPIAGGSRGGPPGSTCRTGDAVGGVGCGGGLHERAGNGRSC